ncbi:TniQ family protein [Paenirhodobacter populi]|uniref:TniQ domain-containing protein n=1 Tax=Paenirhodobacter populi TaxID=2306993 RepID=A0A443J8L6_9RHOB|nr:TniQ family protein [Sinirhodobacter populi]RWR16820.1 hypothetical protein D2T30_20655 [Sinirhodobacter populi]
MALLPLVLIISGETLISYMTRLARCRAGMSLRAFLTFIGLRQTDLIAPDPPTLDRIAALSGVDRDMLTDTAILPDSAELRRYRGKPFASAFQLDRMVSFCPCCLIEDRASHDADGHRIGRQIWEFAPIRTCPRHNIPLIRRLAEHDFELIDLLDDGVYTDTELGTLADKAIARIPSPLQIHIQNRFEGLDGEERHGVHRVDQVVACATLLGACMQHGAGVRMADLTQDQLDAAGACGFDALSYGETGLRDVFDRILAQIYKQQREMPPATAYGSLFRHVDQDQDLYAPLRPILREHILDNMSIAAGTVVFGTPVHTRRNHSVRSLARQEGVSSRRLSKVLMNQGLMIPEELGKPHQQQVFDAAAGEAVAHQLKNAIPMNALAEYLHCDATTAAALVSRGHVSRIGGRNEAGVQRPSTLDLVEIGSIDRFMNTLAGVATLPHTVIAHPLDMMKAAYRFHWPIDRILRMVLSGALKRIARRPDRSGFLSIIIDEQELRHAFEAPAMASCFSKAEAARLLGVDRGTVDKLLRAATQNGAPVIRHVTPLTGKNKNVWHLEASGFMRFREEHLTLAQAARDKAIEPRDLILGLSAAGITPVVRAARFEFSLYPRAAF